MRQSPFSALTGGYDAAKEKLVHGIRNSLDPTFLVTDEEIIAMRIASGRNLDVQLRDPEEALLSVTVKALVRSSYVEPSTIVRLSIPNDVVDRSIEKLHRFYRSMILGALYFELETRERRKVKNMQSLGNILPKEDFDRLEEEVSRRASSLRFMRKKKTKFSPGS